MEKLMTISLAVTTYAVVRPVSEPAAITGLSLGA